MSWNYAIKPSKGLLANTLWTHGDIGDTLTFYDYTTDYNVIPMTGVQAEKTPTEFQGYRFNMPTLLEDLLGGQTSASNVLLAAFNVNPQGGESGAYLCFIMDVSQYTHTGNENWCRLRLRISKRLYDYAGTHYTESWPMGDTAQDGEFIFTSDVITDPYRKGPDFVIFLKTATYAGVDNIVAGWAHATDGGYADCYGTGMAYRMKKSFFLSSNGWGASAEIPEAEADSPEFGPASEPEGYESTGGFDDSSDQIDMPSKPQSVLSLGFVNVYKCDAGSLAMLGGELFPDIQFPSSLSDVGSVLAAIGDSIWNSKLIDYVISVHCVPGNVAGGNLEDIKVGTRTMTGILGRPITDEYVDFDFGSITVDPYYKNYADYMTEIQLYLPMYGFISLRPEEVIGGEINVKYRINVIDGSFTAFVFATSNRSKLYQSLIGQYGGSCVVHLPVSNMSYASMFSSLIGGAAGGAMAAMGVGGAAVTAAAVGLTAAPSVINAAQGGDVKKSNSYNASSSFMTRRKPYLIVTRPVSSFSTRYNIENGFPSNVAMTIGQCSGFTQAENAILDGIPCTIAEKQRIRQYLREGVIIK